jgi:hypothetical protein
MFLTSLMMNLRSEDLITSDHHVNYVLDEIVDKISTVHISHSCAYESRAGDVLGEEEITSSYDLNL